MPFTLEKLADPNAVLCTISTARIMDDLPDLTRAINTLLDAQSAPLPVIYDARALTTTLDDIMQAATASTRGPAALMNHAMIREVVVVASDKLVVLGAQGLRSATFGMIRIATFETLEQAFEHCHEAAN